jgi:hypothetical protein
VRAGDRAGGNARGKNVERVLSMPVSQSPPKPARRPVTPAGPSAAQAARSVAEVNDLSRQMGGREMCLAEAMGDCVAKPIRVEALERSTERRHV